MVCYAVPVMAALIHGGLRHKVHAWRDDLHQKWLNLMLAGGAVFGVVDHAWNGELFLVGPNIVSDLALGFAITAGIVLVWAGMVWLDKSTAARKATA